MITYSIHSPSRFLWILWSIMKARASPSSFFLSGLIPLSQVTSAGKAVDCAVISTRGNMTTRPTAQTTTSTRAWPPGVPSPPPFPPLCRDLLAPLWTLDLHSVRVAVRKSARGKNGVRAKNVAAIKRDKNPTQKPSNEGVKKNKATLLLPLYPHILYRLFSSDDPGENDKWPVGLAEPSVLWWVFFFPLDDRLI